MYTAAVLYPAGVTVGEIIGALGRWLDAHPTVVLEEANVEAMG